jgi:hypothetical protein
MGKRERQKWVREGIEEGRKTHGLGGEGGGWE